MENPIVIFSSDKNKDYSEFCPLVTEMWEALGFETCYCEIGSQEYPLIRGISSSLQSQIVRLYAPKKFPQRVVLTTDIDMIPLDKNYYFSKLSKKEGQISIYSSDAYGGKRYPMCYLSAYGKTFSSIVLENEDETWEEFVLRLNSLRLGWNTDELYVTERINNSEFEKILYERGWTNGMANNRLDRAYWRMTSDISYIDAHCPRPYSQYKDQIDSLKNILKIN
jgi:hypothetical protein